MKLDDNFFDKLAKEKEHAKINISFFYALAKEYKNKNEKFLAYTFQKRAEKIKNCLNYWEWYLYQLNKVKDLRKVYRCKDIFCPNCRIVNISKAIINFIPAFNRMRLAGYTPYHLVLTVPNIPKEQLSDCIKRMNKAFLQLWRWLSKDFKRNGSYYGGFSQRLYKAVGAIKVLEITVQKTDYNYLHIHFHVMIFLEKENKDLFIKDIPGGYQYRTDSNIYYSLADIFTQKLWKKAYDDVNIKEFKSASDDWKDNYICSMSEIKDISGLYEVFKYCFKDIDIKDLDIFKCLVFGLKNKRIRHGYGSLHNIKIDDKDIIDDELKDDIKNYLEFKDELPIISVNNFKDNFEKDKDYKKISIYKKSLKL